MDLRVRACAENLAPGVFDDALSNGNEKNRGVEVLLFAEFSGGLIFHRKGGASQVSATSNQRRQATGEQEVLHPAMCDAGPTGCADPEARLRPGRVIGTWPPGHLSQRSGSCDIGSPGAEVSSSGFAQKMPKVWEQIWPRSGPKFGQHLGPNLDHLFPQMPPRSG